MPHLKIGIQRNTKSLWEILLVNLYLSLVMLSVQHKNSPLSTIFVLQIDSDIFILDLANLVRIVPKGVLVFFPSYEALTTCIEFWKIPVFHRIENKQQTNENMKERERNKRIGLILLRY
jgi:hypothetical protein